MTRFKPIQRVLDPDRKQVITVSVATSLVTKMDRMAQRAGRSRSALVELAVKEYTEAHRIGRPRVAA
jgi:metal-responsive CopG/Arc/MetJ family transcriptional regulator